MPFTEVTPKSLPKASNAPTSIATKTSTPVMLHIAGQTPRGPDGAIVAKGDAGGQTRRVMERIQAIVEAEGGSMADVCRLLIFIVDPADLPAVMEARKEFFSAPYPASTVVVTRLLDPDWLIEVEATAALA